MAPMRARKYIAGVELQDGLNVTVLPSLLSDLNIPTRAPSLSADALLFKRIVYSGDEFGMMFEFDG